MSKPEQIVAELDSQALADLDKLAAEWGCTREHIATTALLRFLNEEIPLLPGARESWPDIPPPAEDEPTAAALSKAEDAYHDALDAFVKVGEDAIARGEVFTHDEVMASLRARYGSRKDAA